MKTAYIIIALTLTVVVGGCGSFGATESFDASFNSPMSTVTFGDQATVLAVYYADTAAERALGLGKVVALKETEGMLFSYQYESTQPSFWMKQVEYPIDIIWVADSKIISITQAVQPEATTTPLDEYTLYPAPSVVDWVVEVSAGYAKTHNLAIGDQFYYSLPE
ncbi:MAG: hypothetical protein ACD_43C00052G0004 [uncultured bacterium]|nr:MAG: hypothetical protein ACD_43C00052G0004 [uncultured bacterium]